jgi:hypothetical protein
MIRCEDRIFKGHFNATPSGAQPPKTPLRALGTSPRPQHAAAACRNSSQQVVARQWAVWTGRSGWGRMVFQGFAGTAASQRPVSGKLGGGDFKRHFTARRGKIHRCGAHLAYEPTLAWASSNANISWRIRAGAMGGGTEASLRWRRIRVMTDSWVMAAMMRREPRRQNGQVAISRSKTRLSFLLSIVLPFNDGGDNRHIAIETASQSFKAGKRISVYSTCKRIGFPSYVIQVGLVALRGLWHRSFPFSIQDNGAETVMQ